MKVNNIKKLLLNVQLQPMKNFHELKKKQRQKERKKFKKKKKKLNVCVRKNEIIT